MKITLTISILCLAIMSSTYAGTIHIQPISPSQAEQVSTEAASKLLLQDPTLSFYKEKQAVMSKLDNPVPNGACCKLNGVKGSMMGSHGHSVCVPHAACQ